MIQINLIPESLLQDKRLREIHRLGVMIVLGLASLFGLVAAGIGIFLATQAVALNNAKEDYQVAFDEAYSEDNIAIRERAETISTALNNIVDIVDNQELFSVFQTNLEDHTPQSVKLRALSLNPENVFVVQGNTDSYEAIAQYVDSLNIDDSPFVGVRITGASVSEEGRYTFVLNGTYVYVDPQENEDAATINNDILPGDEQLETVSNEGQDQ